MNKRIRIIIILIFLSIVTLISVQTFYISKSYGVYKEQFTKDLNLALENSVNKFMATNLTNNITTSLAKDPSKINSLQDSLMRAIANKSRMNLSMKMSINTDTVKVLNPSSDKVSKLVKSILLAISAPDLSEKSMSFIDSIFQSELLERGYNIKYKLQVADSKTEKNDSLTLHHSTRVIPFSSVSDTGVYVSVENENLFILTKMNILLWLSFLLLLVILVSLFYMLSTIYKQKQVSEIKNDFINNMTHELKTPIATVSAVIESMQNFNVLDDKEKTNKYLALSTNELKRLSGLVEKVLTIAKEDRKPLKIHPEELDISEIIDNIVNSQQITNNNKLIQFDLQINDDARNVYFDRIHFTNVIQNLIENSIKYSSDEVLIVISAHREEAKTIIKVKDNGIGIPPRYKNKVFDQFFRVPKGDIHNIKGFGLGLYYVKNIVEKHGGTISVESELGQGTIFSIIL